MTSAPAASSAFERDVAVLALVRIGAAVEKQHANLLVARAYRDPERRYVDQRFDERLDFLIDLTDREPRIRIGALVEQ